MYAAVPSNESNVGSRRESREPTAASPSAAARPGRGSSFGQNDDVLAAFGEANSGFAGGSSGSGCSAIHGDVRANSEATDLVEDDTDATNDYERMLASDPASSSDTASVSAAGAAAKSHDASHTHSPIWNMSYAAMWFLFSTALSIYNKNLLGKDQYNFNFPLVIVSIHSLLQFVLSNSLLDAFPQRFRPKSKPSARNYLLRVVPTAVCTALDISMSNASLHYISLSFYTMVKSSTPVWVLIFAFVFGLEPPRLSLVLVILVICSGVLFTVAGEIRFNLWGFLLIVGASIASGLRWSLTQILLQQANMGMDNPVATLRYLSPVGAVLLGTFSFAFEFWGPNGLLASPFFDSVESSVKTVMIIMVGALFAFAKYYLIRSTSVVTLSVIGMSKEIFVISLSMLIFGDELSLLTLLGLVITISGIAFYHRLRTSGHGHHKDERGK